MIIDKLIQVKVNTRNFKGLKEKGYEVEINKIISINPYDYPLKRSQFSINVKCDICSKEKTIKWDNYVINTNFNKDIYCCSEKCSIVKRNKRNLEKYGAENVFQLQNVKSKTKQTFLKNYGVDHFMQNESKKIEFKEKMVKKYGFDSASKIPELRAKMELTIMEKYGVKNTFNLVDRNKISNSLKEKSINLMKQKYEFIIGYASDEKRSDYLCYCKNCNKNFIINNNILNHRISSHKPVCTNCLPLYTSFPELELVNFIQKTGLNYETKNRSICNSLELDIYLPDLKLAFEFNGVYWHSEIYKEKNYHLNKTKLCQEKGIQLMHIWEDDWEYKQDIVKSIILNKLGKTPNRIYARKCEVKEIENSLVKEFLNKNHLQGFVGSKVKIGLFYQDELVSLMIFGNLRKSLGQKSENGSYELLRFCSKLNTSIIGGASKMFKYFLNNYKSNKIISYSDNSRSSGILYKKLGFKLSHISRPNYYYIIDGVRKHRFNFRKDKLIREGDDPSKTEIQIMNDKGYFRIWDCGNKKWTF